MMTMLRGGVARCDVFAAAPSAASAGAPRATPAIPPAVRYKNARRESDIIDSFLLFESKDNNLKRCFTAIVIA